jgi:molybdopterin-guanine dinucleotide biosynthesis protein B
VTVVSPTRTTIFKHSTSDIDTINTYFDNDIDYMLVEGLKTLPLPRVCVCREDIYYDYFDVSDAVVVGQNIDTTTIKDMSILHIDNIDDIIKWIDINAKEIL